MGYQRLNPDQWEKPPWEFKIASLYDGRFVGLNLFGFNESINNTTYEDVWTPGGDFEFLSAAEIMNIVSTDAADASAGTGLQK